MEFKGIKEPKVKVNLFFNWYESKDRQHEIDYCLNKNKAIFDNVVLVEGRPTFSQLFELTKDYPNDINCFCNSDIYFTDLTLLHTIKHNECFTLCRYDLRNGQEVFFNRSDSQDAWVFRGQVKPIKANFTMGKWGADNHIAWLIQNAGYTVKNPSLSIKIHHLHAIDRRVHMRTPENTVPPPYLQIKPSYI